MNASYHIIPNLSTARSLFLHPDAAQRLGISAMRKGFLRFGSRTLALDFHLSPQVQPDELLLSADCVERLHLPLFCRFELRLQYNELHLGPFIGILACRSKTNLDHMLRALSNYLLDYRSIQGAVLAFSLDGLDEANRTICGYLFNPMTGKWEEGTHHYPDVVFRRIRMSDHIRMHLRESLGHRLFNDYIFDKWEMHQWLSQIPSLASHLPDTMLYKKGEDLVQMMERHRQVIVKPIAGSQGLGVYRVSQRDDGVLLHFYQDGVLQEHRVEDAEEAADFLAERLKKRNCLVQQALELVQDEGQVVDFRLIVVKNERGIWEFMGAIGRRGPVGSIVSNISRGGTAQMAEILLQKVLQLDQEQACQSVLQMSDLALETAAGIERCGVHAGNLGIDMALDRRGKMWLIEVNNLDPNHTIAVDAGDRQLFYKVRRANMMYAKYLAGFSEKER